MARARGVRLGNPSGAAALRRAGRGGAPLREAISRNADRHAQDLAPVVEDIRTSGGATSLRGIAAELNARGTCHPARRPLACLDGHEPVGPAQATGRGTRQSRLMSLVEALVNVAVGFGLAVLTQPLVFPLFGFSATLAQNLALGALFTIVSIARSFLLRRLFKSWRA